MNTKQKYIAPTPRYAAVQGSFWATFCIIFAYASVYLLSKGYSNSQIGVVIAVAGAISAILQPIVADFADRSERVSLAHIITFWAAIIIAVSAALLIPNMNFMLIGIFYGVAVAGLQILTPLVNAIGMEYMNKGVPINFGVARGIGSISYAAISFIIGKMVERYNTNTIPMMCILLYVILITASLTFHFTTSIDGVKVNKSKNPESGIEKKEASEKSFFAKYKLFFLLLVGVTFSFISHNLLNNYMFQIMSYHGGGSSDMGTALSIAATIELPTMLGFSLLIKKFRSGTLLKVSGTFFMIKALFTFLAPNVFGIYIAQCTQILGFALQVPASVYYVNALMQNKDRVKGQAFMTATNTLGSIAGSLAGGFLLDGYGVKTLLLTGFLTGVVGMLITFVSTEKID